MEKDEGEEEMWKQAAEAAAVVTERRKEKTHKYHRKELEAGRMEAGDPRDTTVDLGDISLEAGVCIVLLMGLPGSGKSHMCSSLVPRLRRRGERVVLVQYDSLISLARQEEMVGEEGAWRREREAIVVAVGELLGGGRGEEVPYLRQLQEQEQGQNKEQEKGQEMKEQGQEQDRKTVVVVDDNNYLASMRQAYHRLARKTGAGYCQIYLQVC